MSVHGQFTPELTWSFGCRMTSASDLPTILAKWHNAWVLAWTDPTNGLGQFYPIPTTMQYTRAASLDGTMHEIQNKITQEVHAGTATGDSLPYLNSIVVSERSAFSAKWDRGRFYLPAVEETFVNNNVVDNAAGNKMQLAIDGVFNSITSGGDTVFVTSLKAHKGDTTGGSRYQHQTIVQWKVAKKPARQSRRVKKQATAYFA
jgi:hypothetical protein